MKNLNVLLCALVILVALTAPPAIAGSLTTGAAGLLLLASSFQQQPSMPARGRQVVQVVRVIKVDEPRVFELARGAGVVVFKIVDGKMTSRCFRA